jgi:hypothetical protein
VNYEKSPIASTNLPGWNLGLQGISSLSYKEIAPNKDFVKKISNRQELNSQEKNP